MHAHTHSTLSLSLSKMFQIDLINGTVIQSKLSSAQIIRDESLSQLLLIFMLCSFQAPQPPSVHFLWFHFLCCLLLCLCLYRVISLFLWLYVHSPGHCGSLHFLCSFQFPPFFCASLSFSFSSFVSFSPPPLPSSPSLLFSLAVVGSKWVSDGCNLILQIQQKWWLR